MPCIAARDKFFEHELYKRDALLDELEELTLRERRACSSALAIIDLVHSRRTSSTSKNIR